MSDARGAVEAAIAEAPDGVDAPIEADRDHDRVPKDAALAATRRLADPEEGWHGAVSEALCRAVAGHGRPVDPDRLRPLLAADCLRCASVALEPDGGWAMGLACGQCPDGLEPALAEKTEPAT